jgi:hypothetical protein
LSSLSTNEIRDQGFRISFAVLQQEYKNGASLEMSRAKTPVGFLTELFSQPAETAFVNQVVKWHFFREQAQSLDSQVEPLDIDLAFCAIACNNKKTEPINAVLEISVYFLGILHGLNFSTFAVHR